MGDAEIQHDLFLENGRFTVDVGQAKDSSPDCIGVRLTPIRFGVRDVSTGKDFNYRVYAPGDMQHMEIEMRFLSKDSGTGSNQDIRTWFQSCKDGKNIRSDITVVMNDRAGASKRRWNLHECFPVALDYGQLSPDSAMNTTTLKCSVGKMDFTNTK